MSKSEPEFDVTVILPVFNAGAFLTAALESLLRQTYPASEIIAIDDGSTDGSLAILERFAARDGRIRIVSRENRGLVATLNEGLDLARGTLIARMDADDVCLPTRFADQVAAFRAQDGLALCGTGIDLLLAGGRTLAQPQVAFGSEEMRILTLFNPVLCHPTWMLRARAVRGLRYRAEYPHAEDFDFIRQASRRGDLVGLKEVGLLFRRQGHGNVSMRHAAEQTVSHLRIIAEELAALEPAADGSLLLDLADGGWQPDPENLAALAAFLAQLADHPALRGSVRASGRRGLTMLAIQIYTILRTRFGVGTAIRFGTSTEHMEAIPRRDRAAARMGRLLGSESATALVARAAALVDRMRAAPADPSLAGCRD